MSRNPEIQDPMIAAGQRLGHRRASQLDALAATRADITEWANEAHAAGLGRRRIARVLGITPQAVAGVLASRVTPAADAAEATPRRIALEGGRPVPARPAEEDPSAPTVPAPASGDQLGLWR